MEKCVFISGDSISLWKNFVEKAIGFLVQYGSILDTYILDFFTEDLWLTLDCKWRDVISDITSQQLADFIQKGKPLKQKNVWPLSFLAYRATAFAYSIPRLPIHSPEPFKQYLCNQAFRSSQRKQENATLCEEASDFEKSDACHTHTVKSECNCCASLTIATELLQCSNINDGATYFLPGNPLSEEKCKCSEGLGSAGESSVSKICRYEVGSLYLPHEMTVNWGEAHGELSQSGGQHAYLRHEFRRHVKPKKQHEVSQLAAIAHLVTSHGDSQFMVDIGSGQGHLSRLMAYGYNIKVLCLEAEERFINDSKKYSAQLEASLLKMQNRSSGLLSVPSGPHHVVCHIHPGVSSDDFSQVVAGACPDKTGTHFGIVGLHTCGDLGAILIHLFTVIPDCRSLISVGCCYMKLTVENNHQNGYPLSNLVREMPNSALSYTARELACHAIEMYVKKLSHGDYDTLKVHCYRAALETVITKHYPELHHAGLRSVSHAQEMDFARYAATAVSKLKDITLPEEDLNSEQIQQQLQRWKEVVVFYCIRLILAPVVETVILLDRLLYLYENGVESILVPTFDPQLSARNHVLLAHKKNQKNC